VAVPTVVAVVVVAPWPLQRESISVETTTE
jgi:hypothetical protein